MPRYSNTSKARLETCSDNLQDLFNRVIEHYDCSIIEGHRDRVRQNELKFLGRTKVSWPDSKHNSSPSKATDAAPYAKGRGIPWPKLPEDWTDPKQRASYINDMAAFYHFAGYVEGIAIQMGIKIRWGGDWDRDHDFTDQSFNDLVHFEDHT